MRPEPKRPEKPERLTLLPAREALRRARPLPSADEMAIEDLTDEEWKAFEAALEDR